MPCTHAAAVKPSCARGSLRCGAGHVCVPSRPPGGVVSGGPGAGASPRSIPQVLAPLRCCRQRQSHGGGPLAAPPLASPPSLCLGHMAGGGGAGVSSCKPLVNRRAALALVHGPPRRPRPRHQREKANGATRASVHWEQGAQSLRREASHGMWMGATLGACATYGSAQP